MPGQPTNQDTLVKCMIAEHPSGAPKAEAMRHPPAQMPSKPVETRALLRTCKYGNVPVEADITGRMAVPDRPLLRKPDGRSAEILFRQQETGAASTTPPAVLCKPVEAGMGPGQGQGQLGGALASVKRPSLQLMLHQWGLPKKVVQVWLAP